MLLPFLLHLSSTLFQNANFLLIFSPLFAFPPLKVISDKAAYFSSSVFYSEQNNLLQFKGDLVAKTAQNHSNCFVFDAKNDKFMINVREALKQSHYSQLVNSYFKTVNSYFKVHECQNIFQITITDQNEIISSNRANSDVILSLIHGGFKTKNQVKQTLSELILNTIKYVSQNRDKITGYIHLGVKQEDLVKTVDHISFLTWSFSYFYRMGSFYYIIKEDGIDRVSFILPLVFLALSVGKCMQTRSQTQYWILLCIITMLVYTALRNFIYIISKFMKYSSVIGYILGFVE
ncbi:Hypothetical_protein [Hexamita inflata]|uniref:Hypothetical_protein n=1 Tax=Hexamita inflata TaxID=28002 RepID=A0ABP1HA82_9EUKA